jgi:hypothetical protein
MTSKVKDDKERKAEEEKKIQQKLAVQKEQKLREQLGVYSSQAMHLLELWERLNCDRILIDVQKQVLGGDLDTLKIMFENARQHTQIIVYKTTGGWVFGEKKIRPLAEALFQSWYGPDSPNSIMITRCITEILHGTRYYQWGGEEAEESYEYRGPIFTLTVNSENIYCDDEILGTLIEINNVQILESRIDKILARRITS